MTAPYLTPMARCRAALDLHEDMTSHGLENLTDQQVHQSAAALQALLAPLAPSMSRATSRRRPR